MSRTKGKKDENRPKHDFYETPTWCTLAVVPYLQALLPAMHEHPTILDPGAGRGAITRVLRMAWPRSDIHAVEIQKEHAGMIKEYAPCTVPGYGTHVYVGDFPAWADERIVDGSDFHLCVCNPPYSGEEGEATDLALEFVTKARATCRISAFLLRLAWLASQARWDSFFSDPDNRPHVMVLAKRPVFRGKGADAAEYAWMIWIDDPDIEAVDFAPGTWRVLPPPPPVDTGGR